MPPPAPQAQEREQLDAEVREALSALVVAQAAGRYREVGEGTSKRRIFENGTAFYPLGFDTSPIVGCAIAGVLFIGAAVTALILFMDGSEWRWHALGVAAFLGLLAYGVFRREDKKHAQRVAQLETGTISLPEWLVLAEGPLWTAVPRADISAFRTRMVIGGGNTPQPHLYAVVGDGDGAHEVFTGFINAPNAQAQLEAWLSSGQVPAD